MQYDLIYQTFIISSILLYLLALFSMIYQKRTPTSMLAWLLAILLVPHLAVPLYFLIGVRKRSRLKRKLIRELHDITPDEAMMDNPVSCILTANGIPAPTRGNRYEFYTSGKEAYHEMVKQIREAQSSIYISTYVFKKDRTTRALLHELTERAREGVEVKLLLDSFGSWQAYFFQQMFEPLKDAGGKVIFCFPLLSLPFRSYINLRNHRKIYLFDRKRVLSGGMNLAADYMSADGGGPDDFINDLRTSQKAQWQDILFLIEGPAVFHYHQIFAADWTYASGVPMRVSQKEAPAPVEGGDTFMQVVPSGPDIRTDALFEALLSAIYAAKERIWIVTPYFVPDDNLLRALIIAHHKGVDVKLITPRFSNHKLADLGRSSYMRELEDVGAHVALYERNMLHAKAILMDRAGVMLGSVNMDNRSLFLNYEVVTFAYSEKIINEVEDWMKELLTQSSRNMKKVKPVRRFFENLMRIFAPQL
ncbi:phospholipase D-like domain-containing protein [Pokkaliibacter sp. CJK22405]|uniref:phospholipase D-like domain-containing protein n=1 Tax=Pokkaliibacter sp. CJK22405 TaxID=3384615 RepID=UPI003984BA27